MSSLSDAHVVPVLRGKMTGKITPPWFLDESEYEPDQGTCKLLINGKEAFGAIYKAIAAAKRSVCIICWGFQPSMYFIRDGKALSIGQLLEKKAGEGVIVRVLCWAFKLDPTMPFGLLPSRPVNVTGDPKGLGESNTPGRWDARNQDVPASSTERQHAYDVAWYDRYDEDQEVEDVAAKKIEKILGNKKAKNLTFIGRGFAHADRAQLAVKHYDDKGLSAETRGVISALPSHHQKMVLVDYELPYEATAFVMGHNMLDGYWDDNHHSAWPRTLYRSGKADAKPNTVANARVPLHDFSTRITGPLIAGAFHNFADAWHKQGRELLKPGPFADYAIRKDAANPQVMGQILRTQPQYKKEDIKKHYLQVVANASQYIHIENQYFRWTPLAEKILTCARNQVAAGRKPEEHGSLYLFVITNSSDAGVGSGTVNTYRMLDMLGRSDQIPGVARQEKMDDLDARIGQTDKEIGQLESEKRALDEKARLMQGVPHAGSAITRSYETVNQKLAAAHKRRDELKRQKAALENDKGGKTIQPQNRPGLKAHICTLVAPDTKAGEPWVEVYIHAKLMLIDDTLLTVGSTNINTRSMQVDSELNITHHRPEVTAPIRRQLWSDHTKGQSGEEAMGQEGMLAAYDRWGKIMDKNTKGKKNGAAPIARLAAFLRTSPERTNKD
jgi:phosphatidylserine/phosphatidylglycerophosphate/cardiolipin synthase-like enzyme